jgi:hypothetical protein
MAGGYGCREVCSTYPGSTHGVEHIWVGLCPRNARGGNGYRYRYWNAVCRYRYWNAVYCVAMASVTETDTCAIVLFACYVWSLIVTACYVWSLIVVEIIALAKCGRGCMYNLLVPSLRVGQIYPSSILVIPRSGVETGTKGYTPRFAAYFFR